ncbi:MAG: hypothetical protein FJZ07_01075 [Candidatus Nealsonbacteria bacterium]|nr:hypothetical protein [Candidatus Nealsonbacteria bacterium]
MSWQSWEKSADKGPVLFTLKAFFAIVLIGVVISVVGYGLGWFGQAAQVAKEEFGPRAALDKYQWFIEQESAIKKMDQDIKMFEGRVTGVTEQYRGYGEDQSKWPPHIQVQYNRERQQAREDLIAVASQRNNLVKEYNAASEKFNWAPFRTRLDKPRESFQEYQAK